MNDEVGQLHFFANFDSGNLESASLHDPASLGCAAGDGSASCTASSSTSLTDSGRRRFPGAGSRIVTLKDQQYYLTIAPDCAGQGSFESAHNRSWFYFGATFLGYSATATGDEAGGGPLSTDSPRKPTTSLGGGEVNGLATTTIAAKGRSLPRTSIRHKATFTICNLLATNVIFDHDNRPVYCNDTMAEWERLPQPLTIQYFDKNNQPIAPPPPSFLQQFHAELSKSSGVAASSSAVSGAIANGQEKRFMRGWSQCSQRISWTYTFTSVNETCYFATCYPFSYHRQSQIIDEWLRQFGEERGKTHLFSPLSLPSTLASADGSVLPSLPAQSSRRSSSQSRVNAAAPRKGTPPPQVETHALSAPTTPAKPPPVALLIKGSAGDSGIATSLNSSTESCGGTAATTTTAKRNIIDESEGVYFHRELLCFSVQHRRVDLLTISGHNDKQQPLEREPPISALYPIRTETPRPYVFPQKQIILITCRVHPGETPSSHVLHGLIEFLVSNKDPRSVALRKNFVFKIVPILNPDGVACGHYRTDTRGVNLNRMYDAPDPRFHPTIHAARELFLHLERTGRLALYVDLHAHASKRGCFVFGNAWDDNATQAQALLFPKLLSLNSAHFDFASCDFTSRSMNSSSRVDGTTKGGTGRVALASCSSLVECYTLEASYCMGVTMNNIIPLDYDRVHGLHADAAAPISSSDSTTTTPPSTASPSSAFTSVRRTSVSSNERRSSVGLAMPSSALRYSPETYHELGRGILISLLDQHNCNPISRLALTPYHSVHGVQSWLEKQLRLLHVEQQRVDHHERHKTALEHNRALERVGIQLHLPTMNAYNNASQHKLTRDESGAVATVKSIREQEQSRSAESGPWRLLA